MNAGVSTIGVDFMYRPIFWAGLEKPRFWEKFFCLKKVFLGFKRF